MSESDRLRRAKRMMGVAMEGWCGCTGACKQRTLPCPADEYAKAICEMPYGAALAKFLAEVDADDAFARQALARRAATQS